MVLLSDTISCDATRLAYWQNNPKYNYNRELYTPDFDVKEWISHQLMKLLGKIFGTRFAEQYTETVLIVLSVIVVLLLVYFVYRKRPELFMRSRKKSVSYTVHEDSIYGVDFQSEIENALARCDFREASRLLYLQTLKWLTDKDKIDWQLYKTPTQYVYEIKQEKQRDSFRLLTNRFLRVRYGNFEATEQIFNEMRQLQTDVEKGGAS